MNELNTTLLHEAKNLGLCKKWQSDWEKGDWSEQKMIDKMYEGLDFCIANHWPSNDFIKKAFPISILRQNNVFVNDVYSALNPSHSLILGNSRITCRFNGRWVGNIHVRDNATVILTAKNKSFTIIHLYDNANAAVQQKDDAKVTVIKHSSRVTLSISGIVNVKDEFI